MSKFSFAILFSVRYLRKGRDRKFTFVIQLVVIHNELKHQEVGLATAADNQWRKSFFALVATPLRSWIPCIYNVIVVTGACDYHVNCDIYSHIIM